MESGTAAATLLDRRATPRARDRGASLSIRLSAVIVAATVDEPRVLTVRFGQEPVEALPSGPLEVEHRIEPVPFLFLLVIPPGQDLVEPPRSGARIALKLAQYRGRNGGIGCVFVLDFLE